MAFLWVWWASKSIPALLVFRSFWTFSEIFRNFPKNFRKFSEIFWFFPNFVASGGQEILFLAQHLTIYEDYMSCVGQEILFLAQHLTYSPHENPYRNASSAWALGQGIKFPALGTNKTPPSGLRPSGLVFCLPSGWKFYSCPRAHAEKRHCFPLCFSEDGTRA